MYKVEIKSALGDVDGEYRQMNVLLVFYSVVLKEGWRWRSLSFPPNPSMILTDLPKVVQSRQ